MILTLKSLGASKYVGIGPVNFRADADIGKRVWQGPPVKAFRTFSHGREAIHSGYSDDSDTKRSEAKAFTEWLLPATVPVRVLRVEESIKKSLRFDAF